MGVLLGLGAVAVTGNARLDPLIAAIMTGFVVLSALKLLRGENYVPPAPRKGIAVDEKVLDSYVGTYEVGPQTIVVSRVGRALAMQQSGQAAKHELLAESPMRFVQRGSRTTVTFEEDGGRIERLVVEAGGQKRTATRRR